MSERYYITYFLQTLGHSLGLVALRLFCRLEVRGGEFLDRLGKGVIIAANHVSELDPVIVRAAFPLFSRFSPLYFVAGNKETFKDRSRFGWRSYIYGGAFFEFLGGFPVYRGHRDYAYSLREHIALLNKRRTVCIFPEGKRTPDGELGEAHGGVAYLSAATDSPVVPVAITGLYGKTWKDFLLGRMRIAVSIGVPFQPRDLVASDEPGAEDYKRGAERIMSAIRELLSGNVPIAVTPAPVAAAERNQLR